MLGPCGTTAGGERRPYVFIDPRFNVGHFHLSERFSNHRWGRLAEQHRYATDQSGETTLAMLTFDLFVQAEHRL